MAPRLAAALLALLIAGCDPRSQGSSGPAAAPSPTAPLTASAPPKLAPLTASASPSTAVTPKEWTALLYMAADNDDLPPYAYQNIEDIEGAAATASLDVVAQLDLKTPPGIRRYRLVPAPAPATPLPAPDKRTPDHIRSPLVESSPVETDPPGESLKRFLLWGIERYPARHYLVVVWGHGLGWRRRGEAEGTRYVKGNLKGGIAFDESQGQVLDIPSLHDALSDASKAALGGRPFDIYASDACLMQSLEVDGELADVARYIVGSEQVEQYIGLPYQSFFTALGGAAKLPPAPHCPADDSVCAAAAALPTLATAVYDKADAARPAEERGTYTLATLDAGVLKAELYPELGRLAAAIGAYIREDPGRAASFQAQIIPDSSPLDREWDPMPHFEGGARDLGVLLRRIDHVVDEESRIGPSAKGDTVRAAVKAASAKLDKTIIASTFGARYSAVSYKSRAGVSVWVPQTKEELGGRMGSFASSRFYGALEKSGWRAWIEMLFTPPKPGRR